MNLAAELTVTCSLLSVKATPSDVVMLIVAVFLLGMVIGDLLWRWWDTR